MQSQYESGDELIRPNIKSFNACIRAWYNTASPAAPVRAGKILKWAYSLYRKRVNGEDFVPSFHSFSRVIELYAFRSHSKSFNTTLHCGKSLVNAAMFLTMLIHFSSRMLCSATRAEEILEFMEDLAYTGNEINPKHKHLRPTVDLYNACISAYAKCTANNSNCDVAKRAERLLHRMIYLRKHFNQKDISPTVLSYNSV